MQLIDNIPVWGPPDEGALSQIKTLCSLFAKFKDGITHLNRGCGHPLSLSVGPSFYFQISSFSFGFTGFCTLGTSADVAVLSFQQLTDSFLQNRGVGWCAKFAPANQPLTDSFFPIQARPQKAGATKARKDVALRQRRRGTRLFRHSGWGL